MRKNTNLTPKIIVVLSIVTIAIFFAWMPNFDAIEPNLIVTSYSFSLGMLGLFYISLLNLRKNHSFATSYGNNILGMHPMSQLHLNTQEPKIEEVFKYVDHLTKLLNQQGLYTFLTEQKEIHQAGAYSIQINNFNEISDYYGYETASEIIKKYARELQYLQKHHCVVARVSNNHFMVLCLNDEATESKLQSYLKRLSTIINGKYKINNQIVQFTKSIGYASYPKDTDALSKILGNARTAMKNARKRNLSVIQYNEEMNTFLGHDIEIANKLQAAIHENEIDIYFQKVIDVTTGEVLFVEELARWYDKDLGYIEPETMISVAAHSNQLLLLDRYLIKKSIKQYKTYLKNTDVSPKLALNIAPDTFLNKDIITYIKAVLKKYRLDPNVICIEVAETTFGLDINRCINQVNAFKEAGFIIALDDFGKAFSSLSILEKIDYDVIKIDRLFIESIKEKKNQEIIKMIEKITSMSNKLLIVEGVEKESQKILLASLNCKNLQGFLLHRPEKL